MTMRAVWDWNPTTRQRAAGQTAADDLTLALSGDSNAWRELSEESLPTLEQVTWREEIVVRITQGANPPILESDVPARRPPIKTLLDGSSVSHQTFRNKCDELLTLGDRLQSGARKMQRLYALGSSTGWTPDLLARWELLDERFTELVQQGWLTWSGAAYCLAHASDRFKASVEAKLGFVGDDRRGYHALGAKTFLRHPELAETRELRREMRGRMAKGL